MKILSVFLNTYAASSDRLLTTLALLKVNQEEGRTYIQTYLPFVLHCLEVGGFREISSSKLQADLESEFEIELPHAVIKRLLEEAEKIGKVELKSGVYVVDEQAIKGSSLSAAIAAVERGRRQLIESLVEFADAGFDAGWDEDVAETKVALYINGFSSRILAAALTGDSLPPSDPKRDGDEYLVHRFAQMIAERRPDQFELLVSLVKGRMLADAMYFIPEAADKPPSLEHVEVYLDAPPLLFVLGHAGAEMKAPYKELLDMLKDQDAVVRCFDHCVTEAREILDAAAAKAQTGSATQGYHGDVVSYLVRSGKTRVEIEMLSNRLEKDLLKLGINTVGTPPRKAIRNEPDEKGLEERLQEAINYGNPVARTRDIDSLTAVYRLREGREFRELEKCRAVFVTHNFSLFRTSTAFFRRRDRRAIPLCVFDMALATMLWLRDPSAQAGLPEERIMARAYAALNPNDELWAKYNEEIDRLRNSDEISEDDAVFLRYDREAQEALMDETRGDPDAFAFGTVKQVMARARDNLLAETRAERDAAEHAAATAAEAVEVSRGRVERIGRVGAELISGGLFGLVFVALLAGTIFGPVGPFSFELVSGVVQAVCAGVALLLTILTTVHSPVLLDYRRMLAGWLQKEISRFGFWILKLEKDGGR